MMLSYLKIFRPINLLLLGAGQVLCAYFLYFDANWQTIYSQGVLWLVAATVTIAAFAYMSNDYYDLERDEINHPGKYPVRNMHPYALIIHLLVALSIVLMAGNHLGPRFTIAFLLIMGSLWFYNYRLKDVPVLGNVLISVLSFLSIYMVYWLFPVMDGLLVLHFSVLAGMLNFCRELTKDAEDVKGDSATGSNTLAVRYGLDASNRVIYYCLLFVISFVIISVYYQAQYFSGLLRYVYWGYYALFVVIPLYYLAMRIRTAHESQAYATVSSWLKYTLFTGILSMLFF